MPEPELRGTEQLITLTRRLKEASDRGLQKEFRKGIANALKPLRTKLPISAREVLPHRGGLNQKVAKSKFTISRKASSREEGLRLIAKNAYSIAKMDEGEVRHPVIQRNPRTRRIWVKQQITPGWATRVLEAELPEARAEIERAMERIIATIDGRTPPSG